MILAPFRKGNSFNDFRKYVKFDTDWVDSLLNTLWALYNTFHNGLIHKPLNNIWASLYKVMFSCESNWETFGNSKVQSALSMDSIKSMSNFISFLELLKEFCFLKGASTISLYFGLYICSNTEIHVYWKCKTCTLYALIQHKM